MTSLFLLIITIVASSIIVKIGSVAFELTGLSPEKASFQALSCFAGVGFTTGESELIVVSRQRRKIAKWLIRFGSAGIVTTIATLAGTLATGKQIKDSLNSKSCLLYTSDAADE